MPAMILAIWLGVVGAVVGCFAGLVSLRLPIGKPVVAGRSSCAGCSRALRPTQLVPLLSYALGGGRCASCRSPIPLRYPLMEGACALIGVWAALVQPSVAAAGFTALLGWQLLLVAVVDGEHQWLPDVLTLPLAATGLLAAAWLAPVALLDSTVGAALGFGGLWLLGRIYRTVRRRDGLGGGDPVLFAAAGAWVGWAGLPWVLLVASLTGLAFVLAARVRDRQPGDDRIPFGPFIAAGVWVVWLCFA